MSPSPDRKSRSSGEGAAAIESEPQAPQGPHVETQPALDVATDEDVDDGEFDPQEYDATSSASTSIRSSIMEHEYESGRRVFRDISTSVRLIADRQF